MWLKERLRVILDPYFIGNNLDLLRLLAFQIGGEVSLTELAQHLGIDYKTVARYLDLFEKSFVIYNLRGFNRNLRKEVTKKKQVLFL